MIQLRKILFATDFSDHSEHALEYAIYLAKLQHGKLYILHVTGRDISPICLIPALEVGPVPELDMRVPPVAGDYEAEIKQKMFETVQRSRREGLNVEDLIVKGRAFTEIVRISAERQVDLIVLASYEKSELEWMLLGSTAEKVTRKAPCPVLIIRRPPT